MTDTDDREPDGAARRLFVQYSRHSPRWYGLSWESLREDTRRLFRREAEWGRTAQG